MCFSQMASLKPHHSEGHEELVLVVVDVLVEVLQLLLPREETFCCLVCLSLPVQYVGFDLLCGWVCSILALHSC